MVDTSVDLENDFCLCGRFAWRVHCPHCGSYHNYSYRQRDTVRREDNTLAHLTVFRCRRCNATFNEDDWKVRCHAPNIVLSSRAGRKPIDVSGKTTKFESVDEIPEQYKNALEQIQKNRGIK